MATVNVTDSNFDSEVISSDVPVLVDFWAEWCGPCRMVGPVVEELSNDYAGKLKVAKIDVDSNQELAQKYGITSIPSLLVFKSGEVVDKIIGAVPKSKIQKTLEPTLA
ncbi:MAG: thioredoxin [Spirochaetota bacterium]